MLVATGKVGSTWRIPINVSHVAASGNCRFACVNQHDW